MTDLNGESTYMAEKEKIAGAAPVESSTSTSSVEEQTVDPARIRADVEAMPDRRKQFVANWCFWQLTLDDLIEMGMATGPRIHRGNVLVMQEVLTKLGFVLQDEVGPECIIARSDGKKLPL